MTSPLHESTPTVYDASPLVFLDALGYIDALASDRAFIPPLVARELSANPDKPGGKAPNLPWLQQQAPTSTSLTRVSQDMGVINGEVEALALALDLSGTVIIDDLRARKYARRIGLPFTGTLGILLILHQRGQGLRTMVEDIDLLEVQGMWIADELKRRILGS